MSVTKLEKLNYIDAIRGIAIIMVVMRHAGQQGFVESPHFFSVLLGLGSSGVQLFFIASAFTLFRSYKNRSLIENNPIGNFFIRRLFRIAPVYYLAILYYIFHESLGARYWLGTQPIISNYNTISNMLFLHGFSPHWINTLVPGGWSIAVEMMFYAIFPFLFFYIKTINDAFKFLTASLIFKLVFQEILSYYQLMPSDFLWREYLFYYFPCQLPIFALGIIMFFLIQNGKSINLVSNKLKLIVLLLLPLQIGTALDFLFLNHIVFGIIFVVFGVLLSKGYFKLLTIPIIRYIGKISYSMYIFHFIVISWLAKFNLMDFFDNYLINYLTRLLLILFISTVVSTLSYHLIEVPFQKIAKKIISKMETNTKLLASKS
ncbi:acyltransferase family protein [Mariniflexile sp.]|uniref:acyltransferase family protein n=1 Tax=Mariniflexile sp. TaxID=1979402 RepID=UPI0035673F1E